MLVFFKRNRYETSFEQQEIVELIVKIATSTEEFDDLKQVVDHLTVPGKIYSDE